MNTEADEGMIVVEKRKIVTNLQTVPPSESNKNPSSLLDLINCSKLKKVY